MRVSSDCDVGAYGSGNGLTLTLTLTLTPDPSPLLPLSPPHPHPQRVLTRAFWSARYLALPMAADRPLFLDTRLLDPAFGAAFMDERILFNFFFKLCFMWV